MNTYVTFVSQLIVLLPDNVELLFYCAPYNPTQRALTSIENYFMNFLVYSSPNPPPPPPAPPPAGTPNAASTDIAAAADDAAAAAAAAAAGVVSPFPPEITAANSADIILRSLSCIPSVIATLPTIQQHVLSLYKNKLYAACRDTVNKSEGVIAIASAYQSFLWDIFNLEKIRGAGDNDTHCNKIIAGASGIKQVLDTTAGGGLDNLVGSINPCWSGFATAADDLLDLNTVLTHPNPTNLDDVVFQYIANNNLGRFLIFSWFITSIFGIKTKSKPSKILALGRTYLKLYVESYRSKVLEQNRGFGNILFGCSFAIPHIPGSKIPRAVNEDNLFFTCTDQSILSLTYSSFNIKEALEKYRDFQNGYNIADMQGSHVVRKIQIYSPPQVRNPFQVLGINCKSKVFQEVILQQLLVRFSIIPKGKQFTITASGNMGILLKELYQNIFTFIIKINSPPVNVFTAEGFATLCQDLVTTLLNRVKELNIYTPGKHDVSKFENFPTLDDPTTSNNTCTPIYFRIKWIVYLVCGMINSAKVDAGTAPSLVYKHMKLFILLLKYLINTGEESNLKDNIMSRLVALGVVDDNFGIDINDPTLHQVNILIESEYPRLEQSCELTSQARAAAARKGGGTIRIRKPHSPKKTNNHTRRNKYKRNNKNKKHKSSPKYRKINPSSRSGSQSNRKKSKSKLPQKNVTFKRRRYNK
jgi:hypothetical protein